MNTELLLTVLDALEENGNIAILILPGMDNPKEEAAEKDPNDPYADFKQGADSLVSGYTQPDAILMDNFLQS